MAIGDDFSVAANGDIRHVSGTATYTVLELHRWLQDLADQESASGNDLVDITSPTPSERSTDNIITLLGTYNIDDTASEYFYDGSVRQGTGGTEVVYSGLVVVGSVASSTTLKIVQNNQFYNSKAAPFWGTGLNADAGANILLRVLVKTLDAGAAIDGQRLRVQARTYGDTYAEFSLTAGLGNSTAAIFTNSDLNNTTAQVTVAAWDVNNIEGYQTIDIDDDTTFEPYYYSWGIGVGGTDGSESVNDVYEFVKSFTRAGTTDVIYSTQQNLDAELYRGITHTVPYTGQTAASFFVEGGLLTWGAGATAGTGIILADTEAGVDSGTTGTCYIQLLTGVAPTNAITITNGAVTATTGTVVAETLSSVTLGVSTGTAIIGAFGVAVANASFNIRTTADQYFPLDGTGPISPADIREFSVGNLVYAAPADADRVLVGDPDGNDFNFNQFTTDIALTGGEATVAIETGAGAGDLTAIPSDTPATGTIRIEDTNGVYQRVTYTGFTTTTFTGCTGTPASPLNANLFISYIDDIYDENAGKSNNELKYQARFSSARNLFVRVRYGGALPIKTFESPSSFPGSISAIRTSDL